MNAEEKRIYSQISRRGFMGTTAAAALALLNGSAPAILEADEP